MYEEQIAWGKEAGVDFVIAETINWTEEMKIALKAIKDAGLIAVCNFAIPRGDKTREGHSAEDACKMMEDLGADVVGLNCYRGPEMTMKLLKKIRKKVSCHVAGLPVPYRTTEEEPGFLNQTDHGCDCIPGGNAFPVALDNLYCNRFEMAEFAKDCVKNKIKFLTLYAFSTENWKRPLKDRSDLFRLLEIYLTEKLEKLNNEKIKIKIPDLIKQLKYTQNKYIRIKAEFQI